MSDRIVSGINRITLGVVGATQEAGVLSTPATGVITSHTAGKFVLAAAANANLPFPSGVTNLQFLYIKSTDNVDGSMKEVSITLSGASATQLLPKSTELTLFNSTSPNLVTPVNVLAGAGNPTLVEFILAG